MNTVYAEVEPKRAEIDALQGPALLEFGSPWWEIARLVRPSDSNALREALARIDSA
jgi:thioredoxin 1